MIRPAALALPLLLLAACADHSASEVDPEDTEAVEREVEREAQSLDEAADSAMELMEQEMEESRSDPIDLLNIAPIDEGQAEAEAEE